MKEILAPNLPLYDRTPAVDGYDGGVLPLKNYIEFQKLFLDPALIQTDGRLREQLKSIPDTRWLDLMNAKYIITDKVGDQWYDGVLFDRQFEPNFSSLPESVFTELVPSMQADGLKIVYSANTYGPSEQRETPFNHECFTIPSGSTCPAELEISFTDGETLTLPLNTQTAQIIDGLQVSNLNWSQPKQVKRITMLIGMPMTLYGIALTNKHTGAFDSFVLAPQAQLELVHSGDVKIYENSTALPRAFCVSNVLAATNDVQAVWLMQDDRFDPAKTVVLNIDSASPKDHLVTLPPCQAQPVTYAPERVVIDVNAPQDGYLVLTEADYPGCTATVDGQPADIERADLMFRAVKVPAGQHRVEFRYQPRSFAIGAMTSIGTVAALVAVWFIVRHRNRLPVL
jgi:hypothetical protein